MKPYDPSFLTYVDLGNNEARLLESFDTEKAAKKWIEETASIKGMERWRNAEDFFIEGPTGIWTYLGNNNWRLEVSSVPPKGFQL